MAEIIRISGLKELQSSLKAVSAAAPRELAKTNQAAGEIVAVEARRMAPKGPHQGGGSIVPISASIRARRTGASVEIVAGGRGTPHAVVSEFGGTIARRGFAGMDRAAKRRARQQGAPVTRIRKRAYLYPAAEKMLPVLDAEYLGMVEKMLSRVGL